MIRGKKGFVRILEAFIAILIISGALAFFYVNQIQKPKQEEGIRDLIRLTLEDINTNSELRQSVLNRNQTAINNKIDSFISNNYEYSFNFCNLNEICSLQQQVNKPVFSDEIAVSS